MIIVFSFRLRHGACISFNIQRHRPSVREGWIL